MSVTTTTCVSGNYTSNMCPKTSPNANSKRESHKKQSTPPCEAQQHLTLLPNNKVTTNSAQDSPRNHPTQKTKNHSLLYMFAVCCWPLLPTWVSLRTRNLRQVGPRGASSHHCWALHAPALVKSCTTGCCRPEQVHLCRRKG